MQAGAGKKVKRGATIVEKVNGFSIREVRPGYYFVQTRRRGFVQAEGFATLEAARLRCTEWGTTLLNEGRSAFALTKEEREDATRALTKLGGRASLLAAVESWLRMNPPADALTVAQVFDKHIDDLKHRGRREKTIHSRKQFLNRFAKDYGSRAAGSITRDDVEEWLKLRVPEKTFNTMRFCLGAAYGFALERKFVETNPVAAIPPKVFDHTEPHFWTVNTVEAVMRAAVARDKAIAAQQAAMKNPGRPWIPLTPYLALSAFAGMRPEEVSRLDWSNINFSERVIRVPAAASKVRRGRIVPMQKNLLAWLMPYRKNAGPLAASSITIKRARKAVLEVVKLPLKWPQDVLRHSFATYWMAAYTHEGQLAEMMGNSPAIIQRHYKGLTTRKEGRKYFEIVPVRAGKILALKKMSA